MNISSSFSCAEAFYVKIVLLAVIGFICSFNFCKNKDWTKLVYKFRVQMRFSFSPYCTIWNVLHLLLFCITFRLICSAALKFVVFTGGHEGPESIGCWWFVAVLHSCGPLGRIQGVQRIRHRCTSCSEWLPRWRCSVIRPLLICNLALRWIPGNT